MTPFFVRNISRNSVRFVLAAAVVATVAACGSDDVGAARLKVLKGGAPRTAVLAAVGEGKIRPFQPGDSARVVSGYRTSKYMSDGATHEVLWFRETGGNTESPVTRATDTPVVIVNDTVAGWGWRFYDKYAALHKIPNPGRDKERLDSIVQSQRVKS